MTEQEDKEIRRLNSLLKGKEDKRNGCIFCVGELIPEECEYKFALFKLIPGVFEQKDNKTAVQYYEKEIIVKCEKVEFLKEKVNNLIRLYL